MFREYISVRYNFVLHYLVHSCCSSTLRRSLEEARCRPGPRPIPHSLALPLAPLFVRCAPCGLTFRPRSFTPSIILVLTIFALPRSLLALYNLLATPLFTRRSTPLLQSSSCQPALPYPRCTKRGELYCLLIATQCCAVDRPAFSQLDPFIQHSLQHPFGGTSIRTVQLPVGQNWNTTCNSGVSHAPMGPTKDNSSALQRGSAEM